MNAALHPELADKLAESFVNAMANEVFAAGGNFADVLKVTEGAVVRIALLCVRLGLDERMIEMMMKAVSHRLAEQRLANIEVAGHG